MGHVTHLMCMYVVFFFFFSSWHWHRLLWQIGWIFGFCYFSSMYLPLAICWARLFSLSCFFFFTRLVSMFILGVAQNEELLFGIIIQAKLFRVYASVDQNGIADWKNIRRENKKLNEWISIILMRSWFKLKIEKRKQLGAWVWPQNSNRNTFEIRSHTHINVRKTLRLLMHNKEHINSIWNVNALN